MRIYLHFYNALIERKTINDIGKTIKINMGSLHLHTFVHRITADTISIIEIINQKNMPTIEIL